MYVNTGWGGCTNNDDNIVMDETFLHEISKKNYATIDTVNQ